MTINTNSLKYVKNLKVSLTLLDDVLFTNETRVILPKKYIFLHMFRFLKKSFNHAHSFHIPVPMESFTSPVLFLRMVKHFPLLLYLFSVFSSSTCVVNESSPSLSILVLFFVCPKKPTKPDAEEMAICNTKI